MSQNALLEIQDLTKHFPVRQGFLTQRQRWVRAVEDVSLDVYEQETLGVVGESGCGKTTLGRTIMRLVEPTRGKVLFEGTDIAALDGGELRRYRQNMQMVFQNPYSSFDPRFSVLKSVAEPLRTHTALRGDALVERCRELLEQVRMGGEILYRYPHEFSGGQLQRIAVARALALNPKFIVLDEPTSALDVSVQAQIINLLEDLQQELRLTYLFITHDLTVVQHISHRVAVMYLGQIVELGDTETIFYEARHPYTEALLSAAPSLDPEFRRERIVLEGSVPDPIDPPPGCRFHPRCPAASDRCARSEPVLVDVGADHWVACHRCQG